MEVSLRQVTRDNLRECIQLKPSAEQQGFVAPNVISLAQSKVEKDWYPLCIYAGDTMVGFAMYGIDADDRKMWISRLMIDENYQGRGYGQAALKRLIDLIEQHGFTEVFLSIEPENITARRLYEKVGFVSTEQVIGGEAVFRRSIGMCDRRLHLRNIEEADIALMDVWLHKPYILHWYDDPGAWMDEIKQRNGSFAFIHHFIVMDEGRPIGFCQYYDCYSAGEDWYSVQTPGQTYSVDYLIGEEAYLHKGYGKRIIQMLVDRIREETQAKEIVVQPEEENLPSCRALISCGFEYNQTAAYYQLIIG
ncbi:MAG: GCN5-related N-acetyltransferase [Paenibacillaceae bacterium]|jgi:RimJ/RimL family protein N-acetyltransferase|nr:GCN5-related N-acetyltransferase [Paenibacillaceae bacterium]